MPEFLEEACRDGPIGQSEDPVDGKILGLVKLPGLRLKLTNIRESGGTQNIAQGDVEAPSCTRPCNHPRPIDVLGNWLAPLVSLEDEGQIVCEGVMRDGCVEKVPHGPEETLEANDKQITMSEPDAGHPRRIPERVGNGEPFNPSMATPAEPAA